jgi:hypothetical protein
MKHNYSIFYIFFEALGNVIFFSCKVLIIAISWTLKLIGLCCTQIGETALKITLKRS